MLNNFLLIHFQDLIFYSNRDIVINEYVFDIDIFLQKFILGEKIYDVRKSRKRVSI